MNPANPSEATLFEAALERATPEARAAYLDQTCAGQPELRRRVEGLLAAYDQSDKFLERPAAKNQPTIRLDLAPEESPGTVIGRYKLLQKIGEGGMGVVYMAEQTEPVVRKVAFKIIKLGMDTKQVVARFEAERQALALMDHPNIAKILDAGVTESSVVHESEGGARHSVRAENPRPESGAQGTDVPYPPNAVMSAGRPFFVMELVHGVPITEYCDKNKLSTQQRLELFIRFCQAIQHAHQKGIIHRDIKPSNVMVTLHDGVPVPKVIDFGVAKATNQRLTEKTLFTNYAQMIGTPAYVSPEQAEMSGLDIDTRSDVYSLGVLLYELLTGSTPFTAKELLSKGYAEMQRIIAQQEPPKPSTRMSTLQDEERTVVATARCNPRRSFTKPGCGSPARMGRRNFRAAPIYLVPPRKPCGAS
jgi:eukaryotic-like serine/threonine-protein kinase